jgi:anthranilate synthase/aminodeoxychorismate synthase-like glutamine amidotransferase
MLLDYVRLMRLVLVDAYDSFTHNLAQAFMGFGIEVLVVRCDEITVAALRAEAPDLIVLGPGPGSPEDAGCFVEIVQEMAGQIPLLGVCLGHQAIGLALGGTIIRHAVVHGHATDIHHDSRGLFAGIPPRAAMTRYHSLVVDPETLPPSLSVSAWSDDGAIMALRHRHHPLWGVQFHPESVLSGAAGSTLMRNFIRLQRQAAVRVPA